MEEDFLVFYGSKEQGFTVSKGSDDVLQFIYWKDDLEHREEGPAIIKYLCNGIKVEEQWMRNGLLYRDHDQPSIVEYDSLTGNKDRECWLRANYGTTFFYREPDQPSMVSYWPNGNRKQEHWYKSRAVDKRHRDGDLPAIMEYFENGTVRYQAWYQEDKLHRDGNNPAEIEYTPSGHVRLAAYWNHGQRIADLKIDQ